AVFLGTSVVSGTATALALKTGPYTVYGKIAARLAAKAPETEYQRGLRRFGYLLLQVTFTLIIFVFFINALLKHGILDSLIFSVALAVGLTPDLLPMILSVNLSSGAIEMAKKGVIVKKLAAIQNFGGMNILCADKTGTLTENKIVLVKHIDVDGDDDEKVLLYSYLNSLHQTGLKSPLDEAILKHRELQVQEYKKIDEIPFDFTRKRITIVVESSDEKILISKGAPEEIRKICNRIEEDSIIKNLTDEDNRKILDKYTELSKEGFRVLGVCYKKDSSSKTLYTVNDETDMIFLGYVAFIDPPKESVKESIKLLKEAGIELKILTGDNELVTQKICEYIDLEIKGIIVGEQVSEADGVALSRIVEENNIFCRVTPADKERIIATLKANGHVVGFLGDGINDAPSLKTADVGISVDNAVDVAKEAADLILLEKKLRVLHDGVIEGRKTFTNTLKYIAIGVSSNFGNMFSVAGASLFLPFLPMLPGQILLNNLLYDTAQIPLPTDSVDKEFIQTPRRWDMHRIKNAMLYFGPISSIFDFITFFVMLLVFNATPALFQTAWFTESLITQTLVVYFIRTSRPFYKSKPSKPLLLAGIIVTVTALILPYTTLGKIFGFTEPPILFYIALILIVGAYLATVEFAKKRFYKKNA
ncbi:MAG: magnesium-translocating P-type ATPase, partial [Candidatus Odinarchaeota archaeon]